jgi:hypothetical protein
MRALTAAVLLCVAALAADAITPAREARAQEKPGQAGNAVQQPAAATVIRAAIDKEGLAAARRAMADMRARPDSFSFSEKDLNALGYAYLSKNAFEEAIAVFEFNVQRFPASDNVYDSLSEASIYAGDMVRAEATLNAWRAKSVHEAKTPPAIAMYATQITRRQEEARHSYKPGQPTGVQGPYFGQQPPGTSPQLFAPGVISMVTSGDYAITMSPDGKEFYFTRTNRLDRSQPQVTMVSRLVAGGWTFPEPAPFSAGFSAHEPHVSRDNKRIYWGWFRPVPAGEPNLQKMDYGIWASDRTVTGWSDAVFVGQGMFVSTANDGSVYVTDHTELPNGYLAKARMVNGRFAGLERLKGGMDRVRSGKITNVAHPAIAPDGSFIVFDIEGGPHLCVCYRNADGTWSDAVDLTEHGVDPMAGIAFVSPDGKYLFYGCRGDVYWVSTELIARLRPKDVSRQTVDSRR